MGLRGSKRRLSVALSTGLYGSPGPGGFVSAQQIIYTAINDGSVAVQVRSVALLLPNGDKLIPTSYQGTLPSTLEPGHNLDIMEDYGQVLVTLTQQGLSGAVKVRAAFTDGTGKTFKSKPTTLTV